MYRIQTVGEGLLAVVSRLPNRRWHEASSKGE